MAEEKGFKRLIVWKKAYELVLEVYKMAKVFPKEEIYGLTSQLQRASISIPANIAEGYERRHRKEYLQFLYIAKGSIAEVETYLSLAKDLGYLTDSNYMSIENKRAETYRLLRGLIKSLT
ncbi:MAG: four helix bundle protein [Nitrospinae bacterium]|nr:four helix bundle protein [Nitrospinota bacterium]